MIPPDFPKTPEGTTDWRKVFETEPDGFIPRLEQTESPLALRTASIEFAELLFTRAGDEQRLRKLLIWIDGVVPATANDPGKLPQMKADVIRLLRHMESERTLKAQKFIERQAVGIPVEDRRVVSHGRFSEFLSGPGRFILGGLALLVTVAVAWMLLG